MTVGMGNDEAVPPKLGNTARRDLERCAFQDYTHGLLQKFWQNLYSNQKPFYKAVVSGLLFIVIRPRRGKTNSANGITKNSHPIVATQGNLLQDHQPNKTDDTFKNTQRTHIRQLRWVRSLTLKFLARKRSKIHEAPLNRCTY
jgi:hypothetical protein